MIAEKAENVFAFAGYVSRSVASPGRRTAHGNCRDGERRRQLRAGYQVLQGRLPFARRVVAPQGQTEVEQARVGGPVKVVSHRAVRIDHPNPNGE